MVAKLYLIAFVCFLGFILILFIRLIWYDAKHTVKPNTLEDKMQEIESIKGNRAAIRRMEKILKSNPDWLRRAKEHQAKLNQLNKK